MAIDIWLVCTFFMNYLNTEIDIRPINKIILFYFILFCFYLCVLFFLSTRLFVSMLECCRWFSRMTRWYNRLSKDVNVVLIPRFLLVFFFCVSSSASPRVKTKKFTRRLYNEVNTHGCN